MSVNEKGKSIDPHYRDRASILIEKFRDAIRECDRLLSFLPNDNDLLGLREVATIRAEHLEKSVAERERVYLAIQVSQLERDYIDVEREDRALGVSSSHPGTEAPR